MAGIHDRRGGRARAGGGRRSRRPARRGAAPHRADRVRVVRGARGARAALRRDQPASRRATHLRGPRGPADRRVDACALPGRASRSRCRAHRRPVGRVRRGAGRVAGGSAGVVAVALARSDERRAGGSRAAGAAAGPGVRTRHGRTARLGGCERPCRDRDRRAARRGPRPRGRPDVRDRPGRRRRRARRDRAARRPAQRRRRRPPTAVERHAPGADRPGADRSARRHRCHRPRAARRGGPRGPGRDAERPGPCATRRGP